MFVTGARCRRDGQGYVCAAFLQSIARARSPVHRASGVPGSVYVTRRSRRNARYVAQPFA